MTESEARGYIQGKLNCMNKCDVFERERSDNADLCDNCDYCYSQGNFGQQKETFEFAINALEKQVPKKPKTDDRYIMYICPCCNDFIKVNHNYCTNCGQAIDWSEE